MKLKKMWLIIILKVTREQSFTLSLKIFSETNHRGESNWPPSRFRVKENHFLSTPYAVIKNFAKFTGKNLCQILLFNKV